MADGEEKLQISEAQVAKIARDFWTGDTNISTIALEMDLHAPVVLAIALFSERLTHQVIVSVLSNLPVTATYAQLSLALREVPVHGAKGC